MTVDATDAILKAMIDVEQRIMIKAIERLIKVEPALAAYDLGLVTLTRHLKSPLISAFWSLLPDESE